MSYDADLKLLKDAIVKEGFPLYGQIFNDSKSRFVDGWLVRTSDVVKIEESGSTTFVHTKNTVYRLV